MDGDYYREIKSTSLTLQYRIFQRHASSNFMKVY